MKSIGSLILGGLYIFALLFLGGTASAMSVSDPEGNMVNGWYKDSFRVRIEYGNSSCIGDGSEFEYIFEAGLRFDGVHHYGFASDQSDNPYLSLDGAYPPVLLVNPPRCPTVNTFYNFEKDLGSIPLDAASPVVSITSPADGTTTTASTITIGGTVNDSASGIEGARAIVNGSPGPTASISGNTFSVVVSLAEGTNKIEVQARDKVGHNSMSNTVKITRSTAGGGGTGGGGTTVTSPTPAPAPKTSPATTTTTSPAGPASTQQQTADSQKKVALKFNQQDFLNINRSQSESSDPQDVLKSTGLAGAQGKTYYSLILLVLLLLALAIFFIWQFLPIFKKLDKSNSGLRRRIILIVALPSLIPLIGLGLLGYRQLTTIVERSLSNQLARSSQVSALKLEREFSMRSTVITSTADGILQIKSQIAERNKRLESQKEDCNKLVRSLVPQRKISQLTTSDACLPFLTGFAQLAGQSSGSVADYLGAVTAGYNHAVQQSNLEQQQRVDELLGSVRQFFPELLELVIVGQDKEAAIAAILPPGDKDAVSLTKTHPELLTQSREGSLAVVDDQDNKNHLLLTYPVVDNTKKMAGGATAKYNLDDQRFIGGIWQSTPKPLATDIAFFINSEGEVMYPADGIRAKEKELRELSNKSAADTGEVTINDQRMVARISPVANTNWSVATASPKDYVLAPLAGIQQTALLAIAAFVLVSVLLGLLFVTGIAREIERLLAGALAFARGDLAYRIGLGSRDELQALGDTMDKMAGDIKTAQEALIEKDKEFISVATHELRTPLTAIIGNLSMITEDGAGKTDDTAKNLINQAYGGAVRLKELINDMLDIARLEAGREEFKPEPVDITALGASIIDMQTVTAQQKSITLIGPGNQENLPQVMADKKKLQIVLTNFVSNAIKYNQTGGKVTVSHKVDGDMLVTSVADTGLGIPEDQKSHIFEKFYRVDHADRSNIPGTGLGLHITKRYIEEMGGRAWFESQHGKGTTFFFSLPLVTSMAEATVSSGIKSDG